MNLLESIDYYLQKGYEDTYAASKVAQDIILSKIAKSDYRNNPHGQQYCFEMRWRHGPFAA